MASQATAAEIIAAIKEGRPGRYSFRSPGLNNPAMAAFQTDAQTIIDEAVRNRLQPDVHYSSTSGYRWLDLVVVEVP